ncbi:carbonyl reductase family member 4-like isoform X2 [Ornithodoros turicata]
MAKVACVFGGTKGIGLSVSKKFLAESHHVAVFSRSDDNLKKSVNSLVKAFPDKIKQIHGRTCDVRSEDEIKEVISWTENNVGAINSLINSSGININKLLLQTSSADLRSVIDTNLIGTINTCKAVLKYMLKRKQGNIINIGSIVGTKGNVGQTAYSASKAGLDGFTKSLAKEVASRGIRVNLVVPGFIKTDMTETEHLDSILPLIPLRRIGCTEEVAEIVYFLSCASYMTGQTVFVDGGLQLNL